MIHPVLLVWAKFEQEILPWTGVFGSTFSDEFLDMGEGYGVKYMHASAHPSDLAVFAPWRGAREHAELMHELPPHRRLRRPPARPRRRRGRRRQGRPPDARSGASPTSTAT